MSESENPQESSSNDLRGAQVSGSFINADTVNAQHIGDNIYIVNGYMPERERVKLNPIDWRQICLNKFEEEVRINRSRRQATNSTCELDIYVPLAAVSTFG